VIPLLPKSLAAQLAVVMTAALLVASAINFVVLLGERHRAIVVEETSGVISRFSDATKELLARPLPPNGREVFERTRRSRYLVEDFNLVDRVGLQRDVALESRLIASLHDNGIEQQNVRGYTRWITNPDATSKQLTDLLGGDIPRLNVRGRPMAGNEEASLEILLAVQLPDGRWYSSMTYQSEGGRGDAFLIGASTLITFIFVLGASLWMVGRLARPLRDLATASARVGEGDDPQQVVARGPGDVQQTIHAFNAMSRRVSQLLREKDVMLGALGHDLRTPLASLRIRIENMEPEAEREKAVRTIEEAGDLLEDILELSRHGKSREQEKAMDIAVLSEDMAEDYAETAAPVTVGKLQKAVASCRPVLFRRALRNLIDNAITYGNTAKVSVEVKDGHAHVHIDDDGPGMSPEALAEATQPFYRGEHSRNRGTGGAGLGLTLAEAIARAHKGLLVLENRKPHGLRATIRVPLVRQAAS
jgi:signal transduction histidine kinase